MESKAGMAVILNASVTLCGHADYVSSLARPNGEWRNRMVEETISNVTGANTNRNELISGNPVRRLCGIYRLLVIKRILGRITGHEYSIYFQSLGFTKNFIQNLYSIFQTAPYSVLSHQPKFRYLRRAFTMASMSKFKIQGKELKTHSHSN